MAGTDTTYGYDPSTDDEDDEEDDVPSTAPSAGTTPDQKQYLVDQPTDPEVKSVLNSIRAARAQAVTPVDYEKFNDAEEKAKDLYDEKANRAEWLSLADQVGQGLVRLNAANQGLKAGVDTSGINIGKGTDWESRIDRYGTDYGRELGRIEKQRQEARLGQKEEYGVAEKALDVAAREKGYKSAAARMEAVQAAQNTRQENALKERAALADKRLAQQLALEKSRDDRNNRKLQLDDAVRDEKASILKEQSGNQLVDEIMTEGDISKKNQEQLKTKYGDLAAKAGVSMSSLQDIADKTSKKFWGIKYGTDTDAQKKLLNEQIVQPLHTQLQVIQARKQKLLEGGNVNPSQTEEQTATPPPPPPDRVKVRNAAGKVGTLPRSQLQDALSQGYTEVKD